MRRLYTVCAITLAVITASPARACISVDSMSLEEVLAVDGIFVGEIVAHETMKIDAIELPSQQLVTYKVAEVLKGQMGASVQIVEFTPGDKDQVAVSSDETQVVSFIRVHGKFGSGQPVTLNYFKTSRCGESYKLKGSKRNIEILKQALATCVVRHYPERGELLPLSPAAIEAYDESRTQFCVSQQNRKFAVKAGLLLGLACAIAIGLFIVLRAKPTTL